MLVSTKFQKDLHDKMNLKEHIMPSRRLNMFNLKQKIVLLLSLRTLKLKPVSGNATLQEAKSAH